MARRRSPGLVNFVAAIAYHFCLALPAALTQPGDHLLAGRCIAFVTLWHEYSLPLDGRPLFCNGHIDVTRCYKYDPKRDKWRHFGDTLNTG